MIQYHTDFISPGDTYFCLPGGEAYIELAKKKGAVDVLFGSREALAQLANEQLQNPSSKLTVIGITGTNGKTSVSFFVTQALTFLGYSPMVQGTITHRLTTPESIDSLRAMRTHLDSGGTHFVMEVSSHAIDQNRIAGIEFDIKLLTNISQDHLDYHKTMAAYRAVKESFIKTPPGKGIGPKDYLKIKAPQNPNLLGAFNQDNLKAAKAILLAVGIPEKEADQSLSQVMPPPGRFQAYPNNQDKTVIVDFAHTPDGLEKVLKTAKKISQSQKSELWVVFGCGGDRDKTKRPKMGKIAETWADNVVITADNPRSEDPEQIAKEVLSGLENPNKAKVENDREKAVQWALQHMKPKDVVLVAGKGHETYQIIGTVSHPYSDGAVITRYFQGRSE